MESRAAVGTRRRVQGAAVKQVGTRDALIAAMQQLNQTFVDREDAIKVAVVALLTGMNFLFVGPRGTAKTALCTSLSKHVEGAKQFTKMMGPFTTLSDLIGGIDLAALQKGVEKRHTDGKILECDFAFLDEALKSSDGVLNSLLGVLNDTRDFDGKRIPLWCVGSATNWPEVLRRSDRIAALYDRFHLKVPVEGVTTRDGRIKVLRASRTMQSYQPRPGSIITIEALRQAAQEVEAVEIDTTVEDILCSLQERMLKDGIEISDRKFGQWQRAIQAMAWLGGETSAGLSDLGVVVYMGWENKADIPKVRAIVQSCDREVAQALIKKIDDARSEYQKIAGAGFTQQAVDRVLDLMVGALEQTDKVTNKIGLGAAQKKDIGRAVDALRADYEAIKQRIKTTEGAR
jgi:MoxR-like ATPase